MQRKFLKPLSPLLKKISKEIPKDKINSPEVKEIIKAMLDLAYGNRKDRKKPIMVGLAAPQIGILKRIILVSIGAKTKKKLGRIKVYINPKIIWKSKRKVEWVEGCFSTGRICGIVSRSVSIKIKALKLQTGFAASISNRVCEFESVEEKHTDYVARIFQHEIDHLNGENFIRLIKDHSKLHYVSKKDFYLYKKKEAWRNWPKKAPLPLA